MIDFWSILGSLLGSKMEPDRVHKGYIKGSCLKQDRHGGPRGSPGVDVDRIFDYFWTYFGVFLVTFSEGFRVCRSIVSHGLLMFQYGCFIDFNGIL